MWSKQFAPRTTIWSSHSRSDRWMKSRRSLFVNWTRPRTLRCSTISCCFSAAFSASSWLLGLPLPIHSWANPKDAHAKNRADLSDR
jgi:hypothetical protein